MVWQPKRLLKLGYASWWWKQGPTSARKQHWGANQPTACDASVAFSAVSTDNRLSIPATGNTIHVSMPMSGAIPTPLQKINLFSGHKGARLEVGV